MEDPMSTAAAAKDKATNSKPLEDLQSSAAIWAVTKEVFSVVDEVIIHVGSYASFLGLIRGGYRKIRGGDIDAG